MFNVDAFVRVIKSKQPADFNQIPQGMRHENAVKLADAFRPEISTGVYAPHWVAQVRLIGNNRYMPCVNEMMWQMTMNTYIATYGPCLNPTPLPEVKPKAPLMPTIASVLVDHSEPTAEVAPRRGRPAGSKNKPKDLLDEPSATE